MEKSGFNFKYLVFIALVSALGGFLFGYDWVVIGGAKPFYELYFGISTQPSMQAWAMSSALIGCIIGAVICGYLADQFGRKIPLIFAALLFIISAIGTGYIDEFNLFIFFRVIGGIGIGLASTLSPMYIAEVAPAKYRGQFVAINQLTIVLGILAAQIINYMIAEPMQGSITEQDILISWNGQEGWRWMFWAELIPAVVFFILMFLVPKSPRFLVKSGNKNEAMFVLEKLGGEEFAQSEYQNIELTLKEKISIHTQFSELLSQRVSPILVIGVLLACFQQWCGINVIFNYAQEVFAAAGYSVGEMLFNIIITGSVNLAFTLVAMKTVDNLGRRKLMLFGAMGLCLIYITLGSAYFFNFTGWPVLLLVILAIAIYAMSIAPVTWVILSEIFPNRVRGLAMSISTFSLWIASFILTYTFPIIISYLESYGTFWVYGGICFIAFLFIRQVLPETKGKSLEEIEHEIVNTTSRIT